MTATDDKPPVTLEQLAWLREEARKANASYDAARKRYKRQQKAVRPPGQQ